MKFSRAALIFILCLLTSVAVLAQDVLTNKDISAMQQAGISAEVIIAKIKSSESVFDTSVTALLDFKKAGVPDQILLALLDKPILREAGEASPPQPGDVQSKVSDLDTRLKQIASDTEPKSLKRAVESYPKKERDAAREKRLAALMEERATLQALQDLLAAYEMRLRTAVERSQSASPTSQPTYNNGTVNVRGYYRKDGTYVKPHTRSTPSRRH
jgi:hypothetical protein